MLKRKSTWGSKYKRGNTWVLRYSANGKRKSETFRGSAKEADRRLADLRLKYEDSADDMTVAQFWETMYHDEIIENLSETTVDGYEQKYSHDIEPTFGDCLLSEVKPRMIQNWLKEMPYSTAKHAKAVFSAMFSRAFALELVDDNPLMRRYIMPKKSQATAQDKEVFTESELNQIAYLCVGEPWEAPFLFSAFGGASRYEAMGVQACDIDNVDGFAVVHLKRGVHRVKSTVIVRDELKNEFRSRDLVVPPPYSKRVFELASEAQAEADANGFTDAWMCSDGFGFVMCPNVMAQCFRRWFCDQPFVYHPFGNLRNSYATMMLSKGVDGSMVAKMLGNEERSTTEIHYERPKANEFIRAIKTANKQA